MTSYESKRVKETLCLMNSMILCGESHTDDSKARFADALLIVDRYKDEPYVTQPPGSWDDYEDDFDDY